jgi:hypothetical protein
MGLPSSRRARRLAAGVLALVAACGGDGDTGGLPEVEGGGAPSAYRLLYEVTTPDGRGREEHVVRRPFEGAVTEFDAGGEVVAQRLSRLGLLVTVQDGETTAVETALAPAVGDLRPDRFAPALLEAGRLHEAGDGEVGGRPCRRLVQPEEIRAAEGQGRTVPVRITRCVDAVGLVLEERITTRSGQALRTARAVELEVGADVPSVEVPEVEPLPAERGGGSVEALTGERPAIVSWRIRPPRGFERVGSYLVEQATVASGSTGGRLSLVTEAWRRGPDLLLLDQGRATGGGTPFDPATAVEDLQLAGVGPAVLAVDPRWAEVRLAGTEGGFLRLAGTLPVDDLVAVAGTLEPIAP